MLSHTFEAYWEEILLSMIERSIVLDESKIQNLERGIDRNRVNYLTVFIFVQLNFGHFFLWFLKLALLDGSCWLNDLGYLWNWIRADI